MHAEATADRRAAVRSLWRADGVAGRALPRVRGTAACIRAGACSGRLRRARSPDRGGVEGARTAAAGSVGRRPRRRCRSPSHRRRRCVRPARPRPAPEARPPRRRGAGPRTGGTVGSPRRTAPAPHPACAAPAWPGSRGAAAKRARRVRRRRAGSRPDRPRRRRLHNRCDCERSSVRAPPGGRAQGRGRDVRPDDSPRRRLRCRLRGGAGLARASVWVETFCPSRALG